MSGVWTLDIPRKKVKEAAMYYSVGDIVEEGENLHKLKVGKPTKQFLHLFVTFPLLKPQFIICRLVRSIVGE
jgi:hypothetical protein